MGAHDGLSAAERAARDEQIAEAYLAGASMRRVAEDFGVTFPSVWRALQRVGVERRPSTHRAATAHVADEEVLRLHDEEGLSCAQIADRLGGISTPAVWHRLSRARRTLEGVS